MTGEKRKIVVLVALWLGLGGLLAAVAARYHPEEALGLVGDQFAYLYQAQSLAFDQDLVHAPEDTARWREQGWSHPGAGLFLKPREDGFSTYAKPVLYTLGGAPFVRLSPHRGLLYWNVFLFLWLVAGTWGWLARRNPWGVSAAAALVLWLGGSAVFYVFAFHADLMIAGLTLGSLVLLGVTASSDSPPSSRLALGLGLAMGLMTYEKLTFGGFAVAALLLLVARRHWRQSLLYVAMAAAAWVVPTAVHYAQDGQISAYKGDRYLALEVPLSKGPEDPGRLVRWDTGRFFRPEFLVGEPARLGERLRRQARQLPRLAGHYLVGRRAGLVPYFVPFFAALLLGLWGIWRPDNRWKLWILCPALIPVMFYFWTSPGNYIGGGGTLGNRYALQLAPAFLVLCDRLPRRAAGRWLTLGAVALVALLFYPARHYAHPTQVFQRYRELLYEPAIAVWPAESELLVRALSRGDRFAVHRGPDELLLALDSPLDQPRHQRTLRDGRRYRFCYAHRRPASAVRFRVSGGPTPFELHLESAAGVLRERFDPWETRYLSVPIAATETFWERGDERFFAWLSVEGRALPAPDSPDGPLGSLLLLEPDPERPISGFERIRPEAPDERRRLLWGWQGPEPRHRWAGGGRRSALLLELDGERRYTLSARLTTFIPRQSVTVSLDGQALGHWAPVPGAELDVTLEVPRVRSGPHVVELRHARLATPQAILDTADTRELTCLYRHFTIAEVEPAGGAVDGEGSLADSGAYVGAVEGR